MRKPDNSHYFEMGCSEAHDEQRNTQTMVKPHIPHSHHLNSVFFLYLTFWHQLYEVHRLAKVKKNCVAVNVIVCNNLPKPGNLTHSKGLTTGACFCTVP